MGRGWLGEPAEAPARLRGARRATPESWSVAEALACLRQEHREVLVLTFYRGYSTAEAAVLLGIPAGAVKARTFYALKALQRALRERGPAGPELTVVH